METKQKTILYWLRNDLRISDNPVLTAAAKDGKVLPIYIFDNKNSPIGSASKVWLHHALKDLNKSLDGNLKTFKGDTLTILSSIIDNNEIDAVYWSRAYEPWLNVIEEDIKEKLKQAKISCKSCNTSLLIEPCNSVKDDGNPYKVFTPYYKKHYLNYQPTDSIRVPEKIEFSDINIKDELSIDNLELLPKINWHEDLVANWDISEDGAHDRFAEFVNEGLNNYKEGRNYPAGKNNSRLSPYLHFGQISPKQLWHKINLFPSDKDTDHFLSELGWREFSYNLLYHFPDLQTENLQKKFNNFPWQENKENLGKWQKGQTGYPIVDAGMRELYQTGYMHNRIRMVVGSFLVKNLLIHWHEGEKWFADCLFDADLASNSASWQWIAGCGADAAPYFRIFNPITQGEKFDKDGEYTKKYIPELKDMPIKYLFKPFEAPDDILKKANVTLGKNYPKPIIDVKESRKIALDAYEKIKS